MSRREEKRRRPRALGYSHPVMPLGQSLLFLPGIFYTHAHACTCVRMPCCQPSPLELHKHNHKSITTSKADHTEVPRGQVPPAGGLGSSRVRHTCVWV